MGENADNPRRPERKRPPVTDALIVDSFAAFAGFYNLHNDAAFRELTDYLFALSCRDQGEPADDMLAALQDVRMSGRRAEGHRQAKAVRDHASRAMESIDAIFEAMRQFEATVRFNPSLLEAIFEVDTGDPRNLLSPEELAILTTFFQEDVWEQAAVAFGRLSHLPIREKLARGPLRNETLRRSVDACRIYWNDTEGHSWSMHSLKVKSVREEDNASYLQGQCEAFVSDVINLCGIKHTLQDLASAWSAVDKSQADMTRPQLAKVSGSSTT